MFPGTESHILNRAEQCSSFLLKSIVQACVHRHHVFYLVYALLNYGALMNSTSSTVQESRDSGHAQE